MEFPTIDEFAKNVAEKVLDEIIYGGKTIREWIEIIIKQQPCEDCISREAVRKMICQNNDKYGYSDRFHEFTEKCLQLSPVTPQQKIGKWIFHKPFDDGCKNCNECIECSQCHIWLGHDCYAKTPYCPNCGAKMVEPQESERDD